MPVRQVRKINEQERRGSLSVGGACRSRDVKRLRVNFVEFNLSKQCTAGQDIVYVVTVSPPNKYTPRNLFIF